MTSQTKELSGENYLISYRQMRKAVGWLGMLLPFVLLIINYAINKLNVLNDSGFVRTECYTGYFACSSYKTSISHYYYSTVGELFTGVLCAVALFMFCYKGYPKKEGEKGLTDNAMCNLAGIFALGVVIFPTSSNECITDNVRIFLSSDNTGYLHFGFAALFFITLALMSIVNFRREDKVENFGKGTDQKFYLTCGVTMLLCIALIFVYEKFLNELDITWLDNLHPVFVLEAIALIAFGSSWLKKGKADFKFLPRYLNIVKSL